jgi:hypothetical protein
MARKPLRDINKDEEINFKDTWLGDRLSTKVGQRVKGPGLLASIAGARRGPEQISRSKPTSKTTTTEPTKVTVASRTGDADSDLTIAKAKAAKLRMEREGVSAAIKSGASRSTEGKVSSKSGASRSTAGKVKSKDTPKSVVVASSKDDPEAKSTKGLVALGAAGATLGAASYVGSRAKQARLNAIARKKASNKAMRTASAAQSRVSPAVSTTAPASPTTPAKATAVKVPATSKAPVKVPMVEVKIFDAANPKGKITGYAPAKEGASAKNSPNIKMMTPEEAKIKNAAIQKANTTSSASKAPASKPLTRAEINKYVSTMSQAQKEFLSKVTANPKAKLNNSDKANLRTISSVLRPGAPVMSVSDLTGMISSGGRMSKIDDKNPFLN